MMTNWRCTDKKVTQRPGQVPHINDMGDEIRWLILASDKKHIAAMLLDGGTVSGYMSVWARSPNQFRDFHLDERV